MSTLPESSDSLNLWELWQQRTDDYQGWVVVGRIVGGVGTYYLRDRKVYRYFPSYGRVLQTFRRALRYEEEYIQEAMERGWFQIEVRPPSGITGAQNAASQEVEMRVLYMATGQKPMMSLTYSCMFRHQIEHIAEGVKNGEGEEVRVKMESGKTAIYRVHAIRTNYGLEDVGLRDWYFHFVRYVDA